jgi:hypothetical protein
MFSLRGSPVHDIEIVSTHNRLEVALVYNQERNLGIERAKVTNFAVLLRHESLGEDGQLDEEMLLGQIEVRSKATHRNAAIVPLERKLEGLIDPPVAVDREQLREDPLTGVSE